MSARYMSIAFTPRVRQAQTHYGSRRANARWGTTDVPDVLTAAEKEFIASRDGFYLASVGETGWPYVQFRGGPPGFLRVIDDHTVGWADFRGNRQYISTGNITGDDRIALFLMDYAKQQRLKIFGYARIVDTDRELRAQLTMPDYRAVVERAVLVHVEAFDWNCPQHITPRYTVEEILAELEPLHARLATLTRENEQLRARLSGYDNHESAV
jgi:uncharacterized protein